VSDRPLPSRFNDVDGADPAELTAHLDVQAATAFWRERKAESFTLMNVRPGARVLDVGCGTGADVRALASLVGPEGDAVGVDSSRSMIDTARTRAPTDSAARFEVADALALPFEDASFDAVRCERVLQHVPDPDRVLAEMARVARPGAVVLAIEPDWDTLTVDGEPFEVTLAVCRSWADAVRSPRVGRSLPALLAATGLESIQARANTSVIGDRAFAEQQFALSDLARMTAADGEVTEAEAASWVADLDARAERGAFNAAATYVTGWGVVPAGGLSRARLPR